VRNFYLFPAILTAEPIKVAFHLVESDPEEHFSTSYMSWG
jgi:hypothetical protein